MKQSTALEILKQGHCTFLTGQAGAGKTYVLTQFITYLREKTIPVAVTASTGIAATQMNGLTIHSWSGIGIKNSFEPKDFQRLKARKELVNRLKAVKVLIIDEVSMLHAKQLDLVDEVLRYFREDDRPFGGIQVVLSGDFFQLPPIGEKGETTKDKFAFMSKVWIKLASTFENNAPKLKVCYLSEQHRQADDGNESLGLNAILNQIRNQTITQTAIDTLNATKHQDISEDRTRLYTHNMSVDKINEAELEALSGDSRHFYATTSGNETLVETLKKNVRAPEVLQLKVGAKVMFVKNNSIEGVYNGTIGTVVGFSQTSEDSFLPQVRLSDEKKTLMTVEYETWSVDDEEGIPLASFTQIPLTLAWAITVHKSQGMTLSAAEIDLSKTFEMGQGYVALSRVAALSGLKLLGMNKKSLLLDDFAITANRRFLALSQDCEDWHASLNDEQKAKACEDFVKQNATYHSSNKATQSPKLKDEDTVTQETLKCIFSQKSLNETANELMLAKATIIEHIAKLLKSKQLMLDDIAYLKSDAHIQQIKRAIETLESKGESRAHLQVHAIFDELRESVSYTDIRLALLFIDPL